MRLKIASNDREINCATGKFSVKTAERTAKRLERAKDSEMNSIMKVHRPVREGHRAKTVNSV